MVNIRSTRSIFTAALCALACLIAIAPASAGAQLMTFGSPLAGQATLNTAEDLGYEGTNTAVPASPEAPNGYVHTYHFGADSVLWNTAEAHGDPSAPATGQAVKISLEGCAIPAAGGPAPLTQIHFQILSPQPSGGVHIYLTSQGYNIPVCGSEGASGSTVTSYEPLNLCLSAGDYVGLNDEGGFVGHFYQSGVGYQVLGRAPGSTVDSFIRGGGTGNGVTILPSETAAMEGFAENTGRELMMQVKLGTGADATHVCPGGKAGLPPPLAPIRVSPQTDGINHERVVAVALFCRVSPCNGTATLTGSDGATYGRSGFALPQGQTAHLPIKVKPEVIGMIRHDHGVAATLTASVGGQAIAQKIDIKIF
jgi:hypothetical protein